MLSASTLHCGQPAELKPCSMIMAIMTGRPNVFVLLFAGQSRYYKVLFGVNFGVFKLARILIAVKGKLVYHLENPIALSKLLHIAKKRKLCCFSATQLPYLCISGSVYLLHQSTYSLVTPHRFVRLLFGKTSQNWCSWGVVPQTPFEIRSKFHRICVLFLHFTAQSASSWGTAVRHG